MEPRTRMERSIAFALKQTDELPPAYSRLDHFLNELAETVRLGGGDITDLENRITTNETNITGLQEQINDLDIPAMTDYYKKTEVDSKVLDALNSAKTYTDEQVAAMDLTDEQIAESVNRSMAAGDIKGSVTTQAIDFNGVNHPVGSPLEEIILAILESLQPSEKPTT